jgi:hypothetical protein
MFFCKGKLNVTILFFAVTILAYASFSVGADEKFSVGGDFWQPVWTQIDFNGKRFSNLSSAERKLLNEYPENYMRLRKCYDNIIMYVRYEKFKLPHFLNEKSPLPDTRSKYTPEDDVDFVFYVRSGGYCRRDVIPHGDKTPSSVFIITPTEGYQFKKDSLKDKYSVRMYGKRKTRNDIFSDMGTRPFFMAPFARAVFLVDEHFLWVQNSLDGKIEKVELQRESGEEIVVVHESWKWKTKEDKEKEGSWHWVRTVYQFYRNRSWALKEIFYERSATENASTTEHSFRRYCCEYRGEMNGVPLLAQYTSSSGLLEPFKEKIPVTHNVYEVTKITPGPPPLSVFDPQQFTRGEVVGEQKSPYVFRVLCVLLGILLVIFGIRMRRKFKTAGET